MNLMQDGQLLRACERFFKLNSIWVSANPEDKATDLNLDAEELHRLTWRRHEALQELIGLSAATEQGLTAKQKVFQELLSLEEMDSPRLIELAFALLDNYQTFLSRDEKHRFDDIQRLLVGENSAKSQQQKNKTV
jgi:hypothetical protein